VPLHPETPFASASHAPQHCSCMLIPPPFDHRHALARLLFVLTVLMYLRTYCTYRFVVLEWPLVEVHPSCVYKTTYLCIMNKTVGLENVNPSHGVKSLALLLVHAWLILLDWPSLVHSHFPIFRLGPVLRSHFVQYTHCKYQVLETLISEGLYHVYPDLISTLLYHGMTMAVFCPCANIVHYLRCRVCFRCHITDTKRSRNQVS
jgi:hypothetical protein